MLRLIARFEKPSSGEIYIGENSVGLGDMLDNAVSDQYGKYKTREGFYQKKQL